MGEVRVEVELLNYAEQYMARRGLLDPAEVSRVTVTAVVDTGATVTVPISQVVEFRVMGRYTMEECIVMGSEVLLGRFFLEQTDFFVDSLNKRLIGNPDNPTRRVRKVRSVSPARVRPPVRSARTRRRSPPLP